MAQQQAQPAGGLNWSPANDLEAAMYRALADNDPASSLRLLASAVLILPVPPASAGEQERGRWLATTVDGRRCLPGFTSPEAMHAGGFPASEYRTMRLRDLAAIWPAPDCMLFLDPLTPLQCPIAAADLIRLGSAQVVDILHHPEGTETPAVGAVMQKFLSARQGLALLQRNDGIVSGYTVAYHEIAHLDTLEALLKALNLPDLNPDIPADAVSICALRWLAVGQHLYRIPYGGTNAAEMAALDGWVIEEPPFHGTGFLDGAVPAVQLYRVDGLHLTHGAELVEISNGRADAVIATYDCDQATWMWDPDFFESLPAEQDE